MSSKKKTLIKDLKQAGIYKKSSPLEGLYQGTQKLLPSEKRVSQVARKAVNLASPKGSTLRAITQTTKKGRGRGRPSGTYKVRYLPISNRAVKVPTSVYKKMASAEKAQYRLALAQRKAQAQMQADQLAMSQDPRYQPDVDGDFMPQAPQQEMVQYEQPSYEGQPQGSPQGTPQMQKQTTGGRIMQGLGNFGRGLSNLGAPKQRPVQYDNYGRPIIQKQFGEVVREPRVTAVSDKTNLLNVPNMFNNPGQSSILFKGNRGRY